MIGEVGVIIYPVLSLLLKPLLKLVDLLLEYVDPLGELDCCQLLFLIVAGAERRAPPAAAEMLNVISKISFSLRRVLTEQCEVVTWQMSVRLAAREALQCHPGTAGIGRRHKSEGTP